MNRNKQEDDEIEDATNFLKYCYPKHIVDSINVKDSKKKEEGFYDFEFKELNILLEVKEITNKNLLNKDILKFAI